MDSEFHISKNRYYSFSVIKTDWVETGLYPKCNETIIDFGRDRIVIRYRNSYRSFKQAFQDREYKTRPKDKYYFFSITEELFNIYFNKIKGHYNKLLSILSQIDVTNEVSTDCYIYNRPECIELIKHPTGRSMVLIIPKDKTEIILADQSYYPYKNECSPVSKDVCLSIQSSVKKLIEYFYNFLDVRVNKILQNRK